jgi:3-deoxy-D-manno-octulosonic-acid transferase
MVRAERPGTRASLWPFDALPPVLRWLGQERPDVVVFTERFRFPIFMGACAAFGARVSLINGRCRVREGPFYRLAASFYRWQFGLFSLMAMQSERYRQAATRWAPQAEVIVTGDIKGDLAPPNLGPDREAELRAWLRPETAPPIVVAGSTANLDEERLVLEAFRRLRAQTPARLLLAPRKLTRREEVLGLLHAEGFSVSPRTEPTGDAEVYLLDSLGELAWCYRYAEVAYVGGAMGAGAGHNVLEPLEWGLPVAYGMNRGHFEALQKLCEEAGVGTRVATAEAIADHWLKYLRDPAARDDAAIRGRTLVANNRGSIATTVKALHRLLVG